MCAGEGKYTPVKTLMEMFLSLRLKHVILLMTVVASLYRLLKGSLIKALDLMRRGVCEREGTSAHSGVV